MKPQVLTAYYEAQTSLLRLERQHAQVSEAVKQARYDLRDAEEAQLNYQGSVRSFLEGLSGRKADREETLARRVREEKAKLELLLREQEQLTRQKTQTQEMLESYHSDRIPRDREWAELEARYCAEVLSLLLEENHAALMEYRKLLRGEYPILSMEERQEIMSRPNIRAKECIPWLYRLKEAQDLLHCPFSLDTYYEAPDAWLFGVAAEHNRRDRVNEALEQVEAMQRIVKTIQ